MAISVVLVFLLCQLEVFSLLCKECECCYGDNACDVDNNCQNGCIAGYRGHKCIESCRENCKICTRENRCTECKTGFWGIQCIFRCGKGCIKNTCSKSSGKCSCKSLNFISDMCRSCRPGKHGGDCGKSCPRNCGDCVSNTRCKWCKNNRFFGSYCRHICSVGCMDKKCKKYNGHCMNGCKTGFTGKKCDSCVSGKHGSNCDLDCPNNCTDCLSNLNCSDCKPRYYGGTCTIVCPPGCSENACDIDGKCLKGCKTDFDAKCNCEKCVQGKWGNSCQNKCPDKCSSCTSNTNCINCIDGYYGGACEHLCASTCRTIQGKSACNNSNGHCTSACVDGYHGDMCDRLCSDKCANRTCFQTNALCEYGCIEGYEGPQCIQEIKEPGSGDNNVAMIIGAAVTSGVVVIIMGVLLVACTIKQRRRKGTCATESSGINESLECMHKKDKSSTLQEEDTDAAAVYAQPNKSRRTIVEEVNAVYDTTYENKTKEMSHVIHDYDVLNRGREIKRDTDMDILERTAADEASAVYDKTNDNRNKTIFNVNKDYDILSINREKIPNTEDTTNPGIVDEASAVYDTTYHKKFKQIFNVNNDYGAISADIEQTPNTDYLLGHPKTYDYEAWTCVVYYCTIHYDNHLSAYFQIKEIKPFFLQFYISQNSKFT